MGGKLRMECGRCAALERELGALVVDAAAFREALARMCAHSGHERGPDGRYRCTTCGVPVVVRLV